MSSVPSHLQADNIGSFQFSVGSYGNWGGGYDALDPKGRRKSTPSSIVREDTHLKGGRRIRLQANSNDLYRNFSIVGWAIRRHLDYVSRFTFHSRTGDRGLDKEVEALIKERSKSTNFDRGGRLNRERAFRMFEARRVLDGDCGMLFLRDGRIQGIEADLIRNPADLKGPHEWVDGTEADYAGLIKQYSVYARTRGGVGYEFKRIVPASNFALYGFFERFASEQRRGVSPINSSLNSFRDVYENIDYALVKAKISQLFALAMLRDKDAQPFNQVVPGATDEEDEETDETKPRVIDLTHGPTVLDMDPGEKIDVIESKNPSNELQAFCKLVSMIAFKALDIPYSFFDESHTNYSGTRGGWMHYERSTLTNRDDQIELRSRWTDFQLQLAILDGQLKLPSRWDRSQLKYEWVPLGMPWWKPSEEIAGDLKAIASGMASPLNITKERGTGDMFDNIEDLISVIKYARERGIEELGEALHLNFDPGPFAATIETAPQGNN